MRFGEYELTLPLIPALVVLVLIGVLISLGAWQLERADEKREISREILERQETPLSRLPLEVTDPESLRYRQLKLVGRFEESRQFLLDNQMNQGAVGLNVLTPLKLSGRDDVVLVDRGWLPWGVDRSQYPDISISPETVSLTGKVYVPYGKGFRIGEMDNGEGDWPKLIQYLDFDRLSELLGYPVLPLTVRLGSPEDAGYQRNWVSLTANPQRHVSYAIQWFALGAVLLVIYLALHLKRVDPPPQTEEADREI
ncbi:MAG: SURF1 family protein [Pseudomonadota bacterium]|nr:SURF1 family protein [Pseudomonadota bacterium]